jgi:nitronate monooxygenase
MIVESGAEDIVYTNLFTGVHGNYPRPSIVRFGLDPDNLPKSDPSAMNFGEWHEGSNAKPWRDIWGSGRGIGPVNAIVPASELVARLRAEYHAASARVTQLSVPSESPWSGGRAASV